MSDSTKPLFKPEDPVKVIGTFSVEKCVDANGNAFIRRCNDGMDAHELLFHLESIKLDMLLQLNTQLAERTQRTIITRTLKEAAE